MLKNVSDAAVEDVQVELVLPDGLDLVKSSENSIPVGKMEAGQVEQAVWQVKAKPASEDVSYQFKVVVTAANDYKKIVSRSIRVPALAQKMGFPYTIFSGSTVNNLNLYGWKSNISGDIYTGSNFNFGGSELYVDGRIDAAGSIITNGWKIEINERNELIDSIEMPDFDAVIHEKAQPYEHFETSPAYIDDTTVINSSIKADGDVVISGTTFEGDCYIIAEGNITYNVQNFNTSGRVVLYSRNGNITINGSSININGILYAPNGCVSFNTYETTFNGRVITDSLNLNGSIFNFKGSDEDLELIGGGIPVIDPEDVSISADVPEYCQPEASLEIQINNELDVSGLTYSALIDGVEQSVSEDGLITVKTPKDEGEYVLTISANAPNGGYDSKTYPLIVDGTPPVLSMAYDRSIAYIGTKNIEISVSANDENGITGKKIFVNGAEIEAELDEIFTLDTSEANVFNVRAEVTDAAGNVSTTEQVFKVIEAPDTESPIVDLHFDKAAYRFGDSVTVQVVATDNKAVTRIELYFNGDQLSLDSENKAYISELTLEKNILIAYAYDASGNMGSVCYELNLIKPGDITPPELSLTSEKNQMFVGESQYITVEASDDSGTVITELTVNGAALPVTDNKALFTPEQAGEYTFTAKATDPSGNTAEKSISVMVYDADADIEAPVIIFSLDKDTYFERDDIVISVSAKDNTGVEKLTLTVDGEAVELNENGTYTISNAEKKIYEVIAKASDKAGNEATATANIPVNEASAPVITAIFDKENYVEGDDLKGLITATGQREIITLTAEVNGNAISLDENGMFEMQNLAAGDYVFVITAEDAKGFVSTTEKTITVLKKDISETRLSASIAGIVEYGETTVLTITATEKIDKSTIKAMLNGESITLNSDLTYDFKAEKLFKNIFTITAKTTDGEELSLEISTQVVDTVLPTLTVTFDKDTYKANENITAHVEAADNCGIKRVEFTFDGVEYPIDENGYVMVPSIVVEPHAAVVRVWDTFGNCVTSVTAFIVVTVDGETIVSETGDENTNTLTGIIYTPADGKTITAPTTIVGTADGTDFVKYRLDYAPASGGAYTVIKESTEPINASVLGEIDPTLLRNGLYRIRLTVFGASGSKTTDIVVSVEGNMKVGNFSIAFQDMDVNVAGLPLTVIRSYDSRDRNKSGDFGYGWNMSTAGVTLTESCTLGKHWTQIKQSGAFGITSYAMKETRSHIITINWGNGQTEKFKVTTNPSTSTLYPIQYGISYVFTAQDGSKSKLQALNDSSDLLYENGEIYSLSSFDVSNPTRYRLTKQDGTIYIIHKTNGVESITDPNGNKITFTKNGITHSDGKNVTFNRDSNGRITSIVSPTGKTVTYTYDANGDLASVTDVIGETTRFEYENHYLTNIIDSRGVRVSRNIYDDSGRLIKTIDADGNEIKYDHDIRGREERITDRNGNVTRYIYDSEGNILSETDPMGNTVKNTYDSNGNLKTKTDAMGNATSYNYDASGNLLGMTDAQGNTVSNSYSTKGQLTSIKAMGVNALSVTYDSYGNISSTTDALGNDINYSYDGKGKLTSVTDEIGAYMNMTYDSKGNVVSATNGAGVAVQFTYDDDGNCLSKTLSRTTDSGVQTITEHYEYDAAGNLIKIIDSDGNITATEYNSIGKIASATDEKGRKTAYDYDDFGNLIKITYSDGTTEAFTYDREGNNLTATDRMGRMVTMAYDKVGNLVSKIYPNGSKVSYAYDANYNLISVTSASGSTTQYEYDKIGRNTAVIDALGNRTSYVYNSHSQLESMTDAKGNTYTYSYDLNGNRVKTTYPDGTTVSSAYDARGRLTAQTDQNGYTTSYAYDGADRLTSVTDALGNVTSYTYDEVGNLTSVTDANGNITRYSYDDFGRVVKTTNALGQTATFTYDINGNILTATDYAGKLTTYTYDALDRISSKTTADGNVNYSYTADGKLASVQDRAGTTTFTYNGMDGLSKVVYPDGSYVEYGYDNSNRLTSVSTAYGATSYEYDLMDRVVRVVDRNGIATLYEYDANGNRCAVRYANGITVTYEYDKINRLILEKALDNDGGVVAQYEYTLGAAGERTSVSELDRTVVYTYDALYRLIGEKVTDSSGKVTEYTYAYDNVSNRILKTENGDETVYTYNALNQLVSENDTTYEYDNAGNLVKMISPVKSALYEYNAENKLIKATVQDGILVTVESYTYDFAGNRLSKFTVTNGNMMSIHYLNDISGLTQVLAELDEDGNEICWYTRGFELISQERDGKTSYYLYDGHGSVRQLANGNGKITDTYTYDAWGNLTASTCSTVNTYLYCGEQQDSTTGLYYLRARYMNPATGTFISMDTYQGSTFDPISLHKYLYANANPVMFIDPSGHMGLMDVVCANAIGNILFYGTSAGLINVGMNLIRELRGAESGQTINFGAIIAESFISGFLTGAFFSACGILAASLNSAMIFYALGGSSVLFAVMSLGAAYAEGKAGNYDLALIYILFAGMSVYGAKKCFDSAAACTSASATAKSITDPSPDNTNTSKSNTSVDSSKVNETASKPYKGGESEAGHSLQKHAGRNPDIWGKVKGGSDQINQTALNHLNDILNGPGEFYVVQAKNGVYFLEKVLPDGRGVRLNMDGTFKGFIDQ